MYKLVSLFSGCGGLDLGFRGDFNYLNKFYERLNFDLVWANDYNERACETYSLNLGDHIHGGDIRDILENPNQYNFPNFADIVTGGFPCQAFSYAGKRLGFEDPRGQLYLSMKETVRRLQPKVFVAENVKGLLTHNHGNTFKQIISEFEALGYHVTWQLYKSIEFGIPQTRERVLAVGTRKDILPPFIHSKGFLEKPITAKEALKDLENLEWAELANHEWAKCKKNKGQGNNTIAAEKPAPTMRAEHHGNIEFHYSLPRRLSAREAARIQSFPDDFIFKRSTGDAYRQIGNAVPPVLGWHLAKNIKEFLNNHY